MCSFLLTAYELHTNLRPQLDRPVNVLFYRFKRSASTEMALNVTIPSKSLLAKIGTDGGPYLPPLHISARSNRLTN